MRLPKARRVSVSRPMMSKYDEEMSLYAIRNEKIIITMFTVMKPAQIWCDFIWRCIYRTYWNLPLNAVIQWQVL